MTRQKSDVGRDMVHVLAMVRSCPDRGAVLPISDQPECGCAELTECRAGRGYESGKVTLTNCLWCQQGIAPDPPYGQPQPKPYGSLAETIANQKRR